MNPPISHGFTFGTVYIMDCFFSGSLAPLASIELSAVCSCVIQVEWEQALGVNYVPSYSGLTDGGFLRPFLKRFFFLFQTNNTLLFFFHLLFCIYLLIHALCSDQQILTFMAFKAPAAKCPLVDNLCNINPYNIFEGCFSLTFTFYICFTFSFSVICYKC